MIISNRQIVLNYSLVVFLNNSEQQGNGGRP